VSFNDPGDEVTGRHPPRKRRRAAKTIDPMQSDLLHGTSATPQPPRDKSRGERRKDWVLDEFHEKRHADRLLFLREKLKELYRTRLKHVPPMERPSEVGVSADDAYKILEANANLGYLDDDEAKPWFGSIFREQGWQRTGQWVPSLRDSNNGRLIPTWKWTGA
jgi:hypothetical protein